MTIAATKLCRIAIRLLRESRAAIMIEMAFAIPLLVLIGFGGLEIANLVLAHTRISQMGLSAADNAARVAYGSSLSQSQIRERDINDLLAGVEKQGGSLNFKSRGRIILSSLERNTSGGQWIHWQRCYGGLAVSSSYGKQGDGATGTSLDGMGPPGRKVAASNGTAVMFVEIVYDYQPLVYGKVVGNRRIRSTAAFNIREGRNLSKVFNDEKATVSSCP
ncbi:hypothetical protein FHR22_003787 [Sphingopyxis panaciterrae]|uniref:TadE/TadG family type IV pilus assembly protein n=1 Tax=Sphingopyxis panaciterrae TaxID=363841 RepID=UPI001FB945DE|nr:hypothetical protein [Sphingopyxis panaciterrae]NIJ39053.1 hypothetical protein [Sphingopyxis panaciterrae]